MPHSSRTSLCLALGGLLVLGLSMPVLAGDAPTAPEAPVAESRTDGKLEWNDDVKGLLAELAGKESTRPVLLLRAPKDRRDEALPEHAVLRDPRVTKLLDRDFELAWEPIKEWRTSKKATLPHLLILNAKGQVLHAIAGDLPAHELLEELKYAQETSGLLGDRDRPGEETDGDVAGRRQGSSPSIGWRSESHVEERSEPDPTIPRQGGRFAGSDEEKETQRSSSSSSSSQSGRSSSSNSSKSSSTDDGTSSGGLAPLAPVDDPKFSERFGEWERKARRLLAKKPLPDYRKFRP